jgi:Zn finger protein HypA/HybF involved in hydrogenase expression
MIMVQKLSCKHCQWQWEYKGKKTFNEAYSQYTPCPRCHNPIKIKKEEV